MLSCYCCDDCTDLTGRADSCDHFGCEEQVLHLSEVVGRSFSSCNRNPGGTLMSERSRSQSGSTSHKSLRTVLGQVIHWLLWF